uniref:Capsid protein n=1 Tax=Cressdnaviricota sp. TaxID=2748378 RepID=A0A6M4B6B0_9VIRU|nr:capsid protein [Cressdnaviricota sp.]
MVNRYIRKAGKKIFTRRSPNWRGRKASLANRRAYLKGRARWWKARQRSRPGRLVYFRKGFNRMGRRMLWRKNRWFTRHWNTRRYRRGLRRSGFRKNAKQVSHTDRIKKVTGLNICGNELVFYPTQVTDKVVFDNAMNKNYYAANGFYRFDFYTFSGIPYYYDDSIAEGCKYVAQPFLYFFTRANPKTFADTTFHIANGVELRFINYPDATNLAAYFANYHYLKVKSIKVSIRILHNTNNATVGAENINGSGIVLSHGSSSEAVRSYCYKLPFKFSKSFILSKANPQIGPKALLDEFKNSDDPFKLGYAANQVSAGLPSKKDIMNNEILRTKFFKNHVQRLNITPNIQGVKYKDLENHFNLKRGRSLVLKSTSNSGIFNQPDEFTGTCYHYTIMNIPGESMYVDFAVKNPVLLDSNGRSTGQYVINYPSPAWTVGSAVLTPYGNDPGITAAQVTEQVYANQDTVIQISFVMSIIFWGAISGDGTAKLVSVTSDGTEQNVIVEELGTVAEAAAVDDGYESAPEILVEDVLKPEDQEETMSVP